MGECLITDFFFWYIPGKQRNGQLCGPVSGCLLVILFCEQPDPYIQSVAINISSKCEFPLNFHFQCIFQCARKLITLFLYMQFKIKIYW